MTNLKDTGRLAFREEGNSWNCYWAPEQHTMEGAKWLGSLSMRLAQEPELKQAFMALMKTCFDNIMLDLFGTTTVWTDPKPAPEHERGGKA